VPPVPHSDELRRLANATGNDHSRLSTGAALPTSAPTSDAPCRRSSTGAEAPASASATACGVWTQTNPTAQDARKPSRIRDEPRKRPERLAPIRGDDSTPSPMHRTFAVKRRPTHLAPFSHPAPPRRASTRLGSAEHYAGSTSREARTSIRMHRTGNLQTRLSKMSTRFRLDCCSLETAAGSALHGARPTSATDPEARSGVVFRTEPRRFGYL
jgi:hypothetical protein